MLTSPNNKFAQGSGMGQKALWELPSQIPQPKSVGALCTLAPNRA